MKRSDTLAEFAKAMAQFQEKVEQPKKDADNPFFGSKYVPFDNVVKAVNKAGPPVGLSFTQWAVQNEKGQIGIATLVMHNSGEFIEYEPVFYSPEKNNVQAGGSVQSYLRRYSLSAAYGLSSDEDDDGNAAAGKKKDQTEPTPAQKAYEENKAAKEAKAKQQGQQSAPPVDPDTVPATDGQRNAIHAKIKKIAENQSVEKEKVWPRIQELYKTDVEIKDLTKKSASGLISILASYEAGKPLY